MNRQSTLASMVAAVTVLLAPLAAQAQFQKAEDAIEYRQGAFFVMGQHFGRIGAMANGKAPFDAKAAAENAAIVQQMSRLPFAAFGPGTEKGHDTKAKPGIWQQQDKFKDLAGKMQDEVAKLDVAAKGGKEDEIKAAFGNAAKSCKACHDEYRAK